MCAVKDQRFFGRVRIIRKIVQVVESCLKKKAKLKVLVIFKKKSNHRIQYEVIFL